MDIRQICFISILGLILMSSIYLTFLTITMPLGPVYKIRFINFIFQHLFSIGMLFKRRFFCFNQDTLAHLIWMIAFTGVNFLTFVGVEIYGIVKQKTLSADSEEKRLEELSFGVISYFHLYFQYNIYLGVFCLFSLAMAIVYALNRRRHQRQVQQVLDDLHTQKYSTNNNQQSCSICLAEFIKSDRIYKLVCGHIYHKGCLKDWLQQKLTCPMCRTQVRRQQHWRNDDYNSQEDN